MNEENSFPRQQDGHRSKIQTKNESNQSLLSIVHDKNKTIETLQKQLHFQKLQLKYYLGRTFRNSKMLEFSKSCNPLVVEENIPITLAVNRFCFQVGIKSKLVVLYERMCNTDGRINNLLHIQECLLRKVVGKICEIVKKKSGHAMQIQVRTMITNPEYMDLFNNLLNANLGLKKNLDTFRICCDRLIIIEEERNLIAEQVYSLPVEQRINCNYLIGIQIEKVQLQNRLKEILKDQSVLRKRVEQLNEIEGELKNLQAEYKIANRNCTEFMTDMLRRVNFEALGLIAKSNQQREKYTTEIVKLKCENQKILKVLEQLKRYVQEKEMSKDSLRLDAVYSAGLYQALDKEINQAIQDNEMSKESATQRIRNEYKELSQKLRNVKNENSLLERELEVVKMEYSEARRQWERELEAVQREKNDYKAQVEDLQAIRAAYAQLVDSRADVAENAKNPGTAPNLKEEDRAKVRELEEENLKLSMEVAELKEETNKQKTKIRRLSSIILNLNGNNQKVLEIEYLETKDVGSGDVGNENDALLPKTNSCNICKEKSELEKGIILQELQRSNVSQEDLKYLAMTKKLDEITTNILQDLTDSSNECRCSTLSSSPMVSSSDNNDSFNSTDSKIISSPEKSMISIEGTGSEVPNRRVETTLEIQTTKRNSEKENSKDLLKRENKIGDLLRVGDKSLVTVKVKYISPSHNENSGLMANKKELNSDDRSKENVHNTAPPINPVLQFESSPDLHTLSKKEVIALKEVIPLKVTYRNTHEYRVTTDSDPQSSGMGNRCKMSEEGKRLRTAKEKAQKERQYPFSKYGTEKKQKNTAHSR